MIDTGKIESILLRENYVTSDEIKKAEEFGKSRNTSPIEYLLTEGLITKDLLGQAIAESFGVPYADLNSNAPSKEQVLKIPEETAKKFHIVLFKESELEVVVATDDPEQEGLKEALDNIFNPFNVFEKVKRTTVAYSLPEDIESVFIYYRKPLETRFTKIIEAKKRVAPEIIEEILEDAIAFRASDVHFEPQEKEVLIRFRIDGVLHEAGRIPKEHYENILNRIKVQSHLRIDEHLSAQDGAMRYERSGGAVDLRVSVVPTLDGEKVAIRILAQYIQSFSLGDLGFSHSDQEGILEAGKLPFGMILVTGPTGSGKTTTLYALIKILNRPEVNITTIEDPVEYKIVGVNQIRVNPATNLTFAEGLRSIVRQDPNIILVGEVRDRETAEISVNAALTGHLLLSTFHANDAATAIPRLLDMGVEPFLLASTLEVVIAQRLTRRICVACRKSVSMSSEELLHLHPAISRYFPGKSFNLYKGKGCNTCGKTGYKGRIAIFEIIRITPEMEDLILKNPPTSEIWKLARRQGSRSLFEDGLEKVKAGITTLEELFRVANPPEMTLGGLE
ncbi:MAG: Flp pilus assembly complex ATPase component TadA [Candidatus Liptonbacteria bacterium]|nr:Flp pilus assembly complex ATPase component TadA [Candidatus Liptonbacteria bacterium]